MNWRRFFRRDEADAEQREELDFYLDVTTEEYIERGMEPAAARAAARRKLGNTTLIREEVYRMNTLTFMEGLLRDARHAVRMIRTKPGFSVGSFAFARFGHRSKYRNFQCIERCPDPALALPRIRRAGGRVQQVGDSRAGLRRRGAISRHVRCLQGERKGLRKLRRLDFRRRHGDRDGRS